MSSSTAAAARRWSCSGKIGPAAASWFRERLDEAGLKPGDLVLLSSPGGDLGQSVIMGEIIRARGLVTAVGTTDASGQIRPGSCASACVFVYAGGTVRYGVAGSRLGVHRFTTQGPGAAIPSPTPSGSRDGAQLSEADGRLGLARGGDVAKPAISAGWMRGRRPR